MLQDNLLHLDKTSSLSMTVCHDQFQGLWIYSSSFHVILPEIIGISP